MVAQLVEDLLHLEGGGDRLDQHGRPDGAARQAEGSLGHAEDVVPEPRLQVRFHLRQIEVGPGAAVERLPRIVKEEEAEVGEGAGDGLAVHPQMLFREVPATRPHEQGRDLLVELVGLAFGRGEGELPADGVHQIQVTLDDVAPGGRERVLEVGHEDVRSGVERIDHHLALDRTGDLDVALLQILGR